MVSTHRNPSNSRPSGSGSSSLGQMVKTFFKDSGTPNNSKLYPGGGGSNNFVGPGGSSSSDVNDQYSYGIVAGDHNFDFSFRLEGGLGFSSSGILVAAANEKKNVSGSELPLGLKCTWKRKLKNPSGPNSNNHGSMINASGNANSAVSPVVGALLNLGGNITSNSSTYNQILNDSDAIYIDIPGISTNMYQISADDIGCTIVVEAWLADRSTNPYYSGVAVGEIGPFDIDLSTRRSLDNSIASGGSRFPVNYYENNGPANDDSLSAHILSSIGSNQIQSQSQNYMLQISQDEIKIIQPGVTERFDREQIVPYTADFPTVTIHPLDTLKFKINLTSTSTMHFSSLSRQSRDLIALTIRVFHARRHISTSQILERIFSDPINHGGSYARPGSQQAEREREMRSERVLDLCLYTDKLRSELIRQLETRGSIEQRFNRIVKEKLSLDDQLHDTITSYTGVIQHLQDQVGTGNQSEYGGNSSDGYNNNNSSYSPSNNFHNNNNNYDPFFQSSSVPVKKYDSVVKENSALKVELEDLKKQYLQEKHRNKSGNPFDNPYSNTGGDRAGTSGNLNSNLNNEELRRITADNDRLVQEREVLMQRLQKADSEKKELTTNFSFMKSQYDKLQMKTAQTGFGGGIGGFGGASSSSSPFSLVAGGFNSNQNINNVQETPEYRSLLDERNRFASQVGQMMAELEKNKSSDNTTLEKVMLSNAKILEERDRIQKDLERMSKLYQETVRSSQTNFNNLNSSGSGIGIGTGIGSGISGGGGYNQSQSQTIQTLHAEIAQKESRISELEIENNGLRARIRKLASVQ